MGKSLSLDIRERVVALVDDGLSCHEAAWRLRISAASAVRFMQRKRRTSEVKVAPRLRTESGLNEHMGRHEKVTGPNWFF